MDKTHAPRMYIIFIYIFIFIIIIFFKVTKLCDLGRDVVASVAWTQRGTHLGVGTNLGLVQIWDTSKCKKIRTMGGHSNRWVLLFFLAPPPPACSSGGYLDDSW